MLSITALFRKELSAVGRLLSYRNGDNNLYYGSCIGDGRLEIFLFDSSDPDDMGKIVLSLPEADSVDIFNIRRSQSIVLDSAEDVMKFINEKNIVRNTTIITIFGRLLIRSSESTTLSCIT